MSGEQAAQDEQTQTTGEQAAQDEQTQTTGEQAAQAEKPQLQRSTDQNEDPIAVVAAMVDRGETTLDRAAQHMADSFADVDVATVRNEIASLLPDGHSEKPIANDPAPDPVADESKTQVPVAGPLPTVEDAKADLDANPARTSSLSDAGHVVREA